MMEWSKFGWFLVAVAVIGFALAMGNLLSLPSIQRQLAAAVPSAETAIAEAAGESRTKSFYGMGICAAMFGGGIALSRVKSSESEA